MFVSTQISSALHFGVKLNSNILLMTSCCETRIVNCQLNEKNARTGPRKPQILLGESSLTQGKCLLSKVQSYFEIYVHLVLNVCLVGLLKIVFKIGEVQFPWSQQLEGY